MGLNPILIEYAKASLQKEAMRSEGRVVVKNGPGLRNKFPTKPNAKKVDKPVLPGRTSQSQEQTTEPSGDKPVNKVKLDKPAAPQPAAPAPQPVAGQPAPQAAAPAPQPQAAPPQPIAQSPGATMPPALMHQLQQWIIKNPQLAAAAGLGAGGVAGFGTSQMLGGGQAPQQPQQEAAKAASYEGRRLNPHMVKLAKMVLEKKANLDATADLVGTGIGGGMQGASLGVLASNIYHAPQGHKIEGLGRGLVNGTLTSAGMGLGGVAGMGLGGVTGSALLPLLSKNPKLQALLMGGGAVAGGLAGGLGGNSLGNYMLGKPTWENKTEKRSAAGSYQEHATAAAAKYMASPAAKARMAAIDKTVAAKNNNQFDRSRYNVASRAAADAAKSRAEQARR